MGFLSSSLTSTAQPHQGQIPERPLVRDQISSRMFQTPPTFSQPWQTAYKEQTTLWSVMRGVVRGTPSREGFMFLPRLWHKESLLLSRMFSKVFNGASTGFLQVSFLKTAFLMLLWLLEVAARPRKVETQALISCWRILEDSECGPGRFHLQEHTPFTSACSWGMGRGRQFFPAKSKHLRININLVSHEAPMWWSGFLLRIKVWHFFINKPGNNTHALFVVVMESALVSFPRPPTPIISWNSMGSGAEELGGFAKWKFQIAQHQDCGGDSWERDTAAHPKMPSVDETVGGGGGVQGTNMYVKLLCRRRGAHPQADLWGGPQCPQFTVAKKWNRSSDRLRVNLNSRT